MKEKLKELQIAMDCAETISKEIAEKHAEFEKEHAELFKRQSELRETIEECKGVIRIEAETGFKEDGLKKRLGGIGIRELKILEYDPIEALTWARKKDMFLQLDKKAFNSAAKTLGLDFVTIKEKVSVTFPAKIKEEDLGGSF